VISVRAASPRRAEDRVALIVRALPSIDAALRRGAIVILRAAIAFASETLRSQASAREDV